MELNAMGGYWGPGMAEQLAPLQKQLDEQLRLIQRSMRLAGSFRGLLRARRVKKGRGQRRNRRNTTTHAPFRRVGTITPGISPEAMGVIHEAFSDAVDMMRTDGVIQ